MKRWKDEWKYTVARAEGRHPVRSASVWKAAGQEKQIIMVPVPERKGDRRIKLFKRLEPEVQLFRFEKVREIV